jgi:serine/threonine protein kinase
MGLVYRAWNLRLKRVEAIKVIASEYARDEGFRERFEQETEIAANIDHPHVVTIYDSGEGPGDQLFIAMRYVEGITMEDLIAERGRLGQQLAASLISQVASALDAAHEQGLVHRDVKPANVLLAGSGNGAEFQAYLTDFGLAKRLSSETTFTAAGLMVGTVDYMAPEQAEGQLVDLRADVYALGATLFKALTGEVPYPGREEIARLVAKVRQPPPMASEVAPGVSPAFDVVLSRAMSLNPADRYESAGELGRAALAASSPTPRPGISQRIGPGTSLGDCLLESIAGEGGMGVVYRAKQITLDRTVAVKVMSKELGNDPGFRMQFERECRIAASIDHPNVVPIYSAGEADGVLYVVMRFIQGSTLKDAVVTGGRLEADRAVEVIEQVASALDAAHSRGLVHRDIKPGNVLIDEQSGRVLLTDFGLAKALTDADVTDRRVVGTVRYMAPERATGAAIDEVRADVYSLGCVLWDLLGGTERPDLRNVPGVPRALADVVTRAIELRPEARYGEAGELARAARATLKGIAAGLAAASSGKRPVRSPVRVAARRQPFAPEPLSTGLAQQVLTVCEEALASVSDESLREPLAAVRDRLVAPLRVAIIGDTSEERALLFSGLLDQRILADDLDQSVVFRYGKASHATEPTLVSLVSAPSAASSTAKPTLSGLADAYLVAVRSGGGQVGDAARVRVLTELGGVRSSAVNAVCVLIADDPPASSAYASEAKRALGALVAGVVPCSAQLARAANAGMITERLVEALRRIAQARMADSILGSSAPEQLLLAEDDPQLPPLDIRRELLDVLGVCGISYARELNQAGELTVIGLTRRLREVSGIEEVRREIDGLQQRADALKAARGLAELEQASYRGPGLSFLRDRVESLRFEPRMHVLDLVQALERCVADDIELPDELLAELERLVTAPSPGGRLGIAGNAEGAELTRAALAKFQSWKMFENSGRASPAARRIADVVMRSLHLIGLDSEQAASGLPPV